MADPHVITALVAKHRDLAGQIEHFEKQIKAARADIKTVDAAIKLFDPDYDLRGIKAKQHRSRSKAFGRGEVNRLVLGELRESDRPVSTVEIAEGVAGKKGLDLNEGEAKALQATVLTVLSRQRAKGLIVEDSREGGVIRWKVCG